MKSVLVSAALAASLAIGSVAFASTEYELGTIKAIDPVAHTVTTDAGKVFTFPATIDLSAFKVGEVVRINFTPDGNMLDGTAIKAN